VGGAHAPYVQSQRKEVYDQALADLAARGLLYECYCSRREIAEAANAPHAADEEGPAYPGTCRVPQPGRPTRGPCALRLRVPEGEVAFTDAVYGEQLRSPAREVGDFVVRRKDGVAAYQLAVVVDDAAMQITDVLRGADLLSSTARQILLYRALDLPEPRWTHVPLVLDESGERFSKRAGALSLRELREAGAAPEPLVGWLASTCGLARTGEELSARDLVSRYDPARLPRADTPVRIPRWLTRTGQPRL